MSFLDDIDSGEAQAYNAGYASVDARGDRYDAEIAQAKAVGELEGDEVGLVLGTVIGTLRAFDRTGLGPAPGNARALEPLRAEVDALIKKVQDREWYDDADTDADEAAVNRRRLVPLWDMCRAYGRWLRSELRRDRKAGNETPIFGEGFEETTDQKRVLQFATEFSPTKYEW